MFVRDWSADCADRPREMLLCGLGFRGVGFGVEGLEFSVQGLGVTIQILWFRVVGLGFWVKG